MNLLEEFKSLTDSDKQEFVKMIIEEMKKTDCFKQSVDELTISLKNYQKGDGLMKPDIKKELEQCFDQILKNYDSKTNNEKEEATSFPEFQNGLRAFGGMPLSH